MCPSCQTCYGLEEVPAGPWECILCEIGLSNADGGDIRCAICYQRKKGIFKRVSKESRCVVDRGEWAHAACAFWSSGCGFDPPETKEDVTGIDFLDAGLFNQSTSCAICGGTEGAKLKCSAPHCTSHFHAICGLERHWIEDWFYWSFELEEEVVRQDYHFDDDGNKVLQPYCNTHGPVRQFKVTPDHPYSLKEAAAAVHQAAVQTVTREDKEVNRRAEARRVARQQQQPSGRSSRRETEAEQKVDVDEEEEEAKKSRPLDKRKGAQRRAEAPEEVSAAAKEDALRRLEQKRREDRQRKAQEPLVLSRPTPNPTSTSTASSSASTSPSSSSIAAQLANKRSEMRVKLQAHLSLPLARALEEETFKANPPPLPSSSNPEPPLLSLQYTAHLRSVLFNLQNNRRLLADLILGNVTVAQLAAMRPEEMASEELKGQRQRSWKEMREEAVLDHPGTLRLEDSQATPPSNLVDSQALTSQRTMASLAMTFSQLHEEEDLTEEQAHRELEVRQKGAAVKELVEEDADSEKKVGSGDEIEDVDVPQTKRRRLRHLDLAAA